MKKKQIAGVLFYITIFCMTAFTAEKRYSVEGFSEIHYSIPGTLYLTQSNQFQIIVKGTREQIEDMVIEKNGNVLSIEQEWSLFGIGSASLEGVEVRIELPSLEAVTTSSSGSIQGLTTFSNSNTIKIAAGSSGNISLSVQADTIEANSSSSGSVQLKGNVAVLVLETTSSGEIGFSGEVTESLQASASSIGKITCELDTNTVVPESRLNIGSLGDITVTGKGDRVVAESSSGGDLLLKEFQCNDMKVNLSSAGSAFINVIGYLDMNTSSSGRIVNHGSPQMN